MEQPNILRIEQGKCVSYQGCDYIIKKVVDIKRVILENPKTGQLTQASIKDLCPLSSIKLLEGKSQDIELALINDNTWQEAKRKFEIIKPIINGYLNDIEIRDLASKNGVNRATIYRWVHNYYRKGEKISALINEKHPGGKFKSRLSPELDELIKVVIEDVFLSKQKRTVKNVYKELQLMCKNQGISPPHINTIRNRILDLTEEEICARREGKEIARYRFEPLRGHFPDTDGPLSVIQIDHTPVDIILVDEVQRLPIGRPWLTMAIDIYSRMVVGFYLSFDTPGAVGTGMCISNAILPKELHLSKLDIEGEWPCWGVMKKIHLDNAKEFKGHMLERAGEEYGIKIEFRPKRSPHYGGHIERLLGTFSKEIHSLPGTTFSNIKEKGKYDSKKEAAFSFKEFEKWLTTYIIEVYHQRVHSSIKMSPLQKYKEGIFGNQTHKGVGIPPRVIDERKVKLDFTPYIERTIQEYGVIIDYIYYYHEVLRRWVHSKKGNSLNSKAKRKFLFRRDPRDISVIYFYDPEINEYFDIPYRDTSHPPITLWEHKEILRRLEESGNTEINEEQIFDAYKKLKIIEENAIKKTHKARIFKQSAKKAVSQENSIKKIEKILLSESFLPDLNISEVQPFDDIDDESPFS